MFIKRSEKAKREQETDREQSLTLVLPSLQPSDINACKKKNRQDNILKFSSHVSHVLVCFSVRLLDFSVWISTKVFKEQAKGNYCPYP